MDAKRWEEVKLILNACLDAEPDQREAYLIAACGSDAALLAEARSLLASDAELGTFLEVSIPERQREENLARRQLGSYRIIEPIAQGGMGTVYKAVRANDFDKRVAIKVVKRGLDTDFILQRFRQERQILAALDHPNIARLLDGGATDDGRPYLVMEFIEGTPLTRYCEERQLPESARLELFRTVCSAVQFAHQNLVVHRDLKPSNILVTTIGEPKLLDFGIAKLLEQNADATMTSIRMLSPECASPEQVRGEPITTASDIYSLGVLLYTLLSGEPPYRFQTKTAEEITRVVCDTEPKKPSAVRPVHPDLDNIAMKAMHKTPSRRYTSVEQLSEDIRRYSVGLPVTARKDTAAYRMSKFVRRHAGASIAAGLAALSLVGGMAATLWQSHQRAAQQKIATAVSDFLRHDLLAQAGASAQSEVDAKPDPDLKVRTALDRSAARIEGKFKSQPLVEASIRQTIGDAYEDLGLFREAQPQVERTIVLRRAALGENDPETLASMHSLAGILAGEGKYAEAEMLETRVLDSQRRVLGERNPATLASMNALGNIYKHLGKYGAAETLQSKSLDLRREVLGAENPDTLASMNDLATFYEDQGKFPQAETLYTNAQEIRRRALGEEHPQSLIGMNNLASLYSKEGKYAEAEQINTRLLEIRRGVLGNDHPLTLATINNLAVNLTRQKKYEQAEALFAEVLETRRRELGEANLDTVISMNNLAFLDRQEGKDAQAESLYERALAERRNLQGNQHPDTLLAMVNLATLFVHEAKYTQAEPLARKAVAGYANSNPGAWQGYNARCVLGESLAGQGNYQLPEPLLLAGYQGMVEREASIPAGNRASVGQAGEWIVRLYLRWNRPKDAADWKSKLAQ
jgi:eukaryotic-like serine/threonine-protein kinase